MTPELSQLYAKCVSLKGDDRVAFAIEHNLDFGQVWLLAKKLKRGRRASKSEKKVARQAQANLCPLCRDELISATRMDHITGKLFCSACQLRLANYRAAIAAGVTSEMLDEFSKPPPIEDPFDPGSPDL